MSEKEIFEQLESLVEDRKSFITNNSEDNEIFKKDAIALESIIKKYVQAKKTLEQKDNTIDKCIELVNQWKDFCDRNYEEESNDNISIQNNIYWKDCVGHLNYLLEKLQQAKGVCDE